MNTDEIPIQLPADQAQAVADALIDSIREDQKFKRELWDGDTCARYLNVEPRQFKERISKLSGFPRARLIAANDDSLRPAKRWHRDEVKAFATATREAR